MNVGKLKDKDSTQNECFQRMLGKSKAIRNLKEIILKVAKNNATVLITGPTGSGKEVAARAIHENSARGKAPFIAVNCGSIPAELFESELFGHERGSFTSAFESKPGKFELAHGGTLFLDEVGTLPSQLQAKLLRVLQEKEIERVGGIKSTPVDVRIISATNVDLKHEVQRGSFREDLYHRLHVIPLYVPGLKERIEDIEPFLYAFLQEYGEKYGNIFKAIEPKALATLKGYYWPGNIRELRHICERIVALYKGPVLCRDHLPVEVHLTRRSPYKQGSFQEVIVAYAKELISEALYNTGGNHTKAAQFLGMKRTTLISKLKQYKFQPAMVS